MLVKEKGTGSSTKSSQKKAKRAAAKARQDIAGALPTKSVRDAIKPPQDTVYKIPERIPKKSEVIPVLSLAPPSPRAKDTQERLENPSETVTIPSQSFAPPPLCPFKNPFKSLPVATRQSPLSVHA